MEIITDTYSRYKLFTIANHSHFLFSAARISKLPGTGTCVPNTRVLVGQGITSSIWYNIIYYDERRTSKAQHDHSSCQVPTVAPYVVLSTTTSPYYYQVPG